MDLKQFAGTSMRDLRRELERRASVHKSKRSLAPGEPAGDADTALLIEVLRQRQKVIWGTDDRLDLVEVTDPSIHADAESVVLLCKAHELSSEGDGTATLSAKTFGEDRGICRAEPYFAQPVAGFCSGFLVAPDVVATAGHCIDESTLDLVRFVFGFRMLDGKTAALTVRDADVYRGVAMLGRRMTPEGPDWALVRLERAVRGARVAQVRRSGRIERGQPLHVIGHPCGLPLKYAGGAVVRENSRDAFFLANLDSYGGNSGSPVFNSETHEVEGILVRGEPDFVFKGDCMVSMVMPQDSADGVGEACTRTTEWIAHLEAAVASPDTSPATGATPPAAPPATGATVPPTSPEPSAAPASADLPADGGFERFARDLRAYMKGLLGI
jgi:Trypsin-like peptidase domain